MREIEVGDSSITFKTSKGIIFDIETRKELGIRILMNGYQILNIDSNGEDE